VRLSPSIAILRTQSDERLVDLARDGSDAAFSAIVERYRRQMMRGCRRVLPESRAEDAVQQSFIAAWRALQRGDAVTDLHAWLMRIARNTALNALRVSGYDYDELRDSLRGSEAPQGELERRDVVRQTLAGLAALPERQREALMRSAIEGASHAEIAKALGLSEGATRQLVLRARATMRSAATALTPGPLIGWAAGGGAGAGALLVKVSVATVIAGGVVVAPSVVPHSPERAKADSAPVSAVAPAKQASSAASALASRTNVSSSSSSGSGHHGSSSGAGAKGASSSSSSGKGSAAKDSSGPGSGGDDSTAAKPDDSSGPGSGESTEVDNSGSGSASSGSGSDASGSDDSGSGGAGGSDGSGSSSGDSGSDDSGSGESGPGGSDDSGSGESGSSGSGSGSGSHEGGKPEIP
jgi:RNA polymerase sigma factor (sigma-70 family)